MNIVTINNIVQGRDCNFRRNKRERVHSMKSKFLCNEYSKRDLGKLIHKNHEKNMFFTLDQLLLKAKEHFYYDEGQITFFKIIKNMGYKNRRANGRKLLCEQNLVIAHFPGTPSTYFQ